MHKTLSKPDTTLPHISRRTFLIGTTQVIACMVGLIGSYRTVAAAEDTTIQLGGYGKGVYGCGTYAGMGATVAGVDTQVSDRAAYRVFLPLVAKEEAGERVSTHSVNKIYLPIVTKENN